MRELENMLHREFLMSEGNRIQFGQDNVRMNDRRKNVFDRHQNFFLEYSFNEAKKRAIDQFEKKNLGCLMQKANGNVTKAAKCAGKERRALGKLLKKHGLAQNIR